MCAVSQRQSASGFTLIEVAIVVVIIGLLAAVVSTANELYANSKINAQVKQIASLNAAVRSFEDIYHGLPGDLVNGVALGLQTYNGDANGIIYGFIGAESVDVAHTLSAASLIPGSYDAATAELIPAAIGTGSLIPSGYPYEAAKRTPLVNYWYIAYPYSTVIPQGLLPGGIVYRLDQKMDDGLPYAGIAILLASNNGAIVNYLTDSNNFYGAAAFSNTDCTATAVNYSQNDTATRYNIKGKITECALAVSWKLN